MKSFRSIIFFLFAASFLAGCGGVDECNEYSIILGDSVKSRALERWADMNVFSKKFKDENFDYVGSFVGPGKGGASFSKNTIDTTSVMHIRNYSIRSVGPDKFQPDVIFIGRKRYQGILITKRDFEESLSKTTVDKTRVESRNGRLAMLCYRES